MAALTTACEHCGLDCGSSPILGDELCFCCLGCQTVYGILHEAGLGTFYAIESRPGVRPDEDGGEQRFAFLDDESIRPEMLDFFDGRNARVTFHVPGIHCLACVWLLERLHQIDPRVGGSEVHFPRREVSIRFDVQEIALSEVATLVDRLGYTPDLNLAALQDKPQQSSADRARRRLFLQLGVAGFCFGNVMMLSFPGYLGLELTDGFSRLFGGLAFGLAMPALLYSGIDYFRSAWTGLRQAASDHRSADCHRHGGPVLAEQLRCARRHRRGLLRFADRTGLLPSDRKWFQLRSYDAMSFDRDFRSYFPLCSRRLERAKNAASRSNNWKQVT